VITLCLRSDTSCHFATLIVLVTYLLTNIAITFHICTPEMLIKGKVALYTQQTYVGLGVWLGLGVGLGL